MKVGFLGLGIMGEACARNLLKSNLFDSVVIWNRSPDKCKQLVEEGAKQAATPAEVINECDITFGESRTTC